MQISKVLINMLAQTIIKNNKKKENAIKQNYFNFVGA